MEIARLAPLAGEDAAEKVFERPLFCKVSATDDESGIIARRGLVAAGILTFLQEEEADFDLQEWGRVWLAPDNPFLNAVQKQRLDDDGVIQVGTVLQEGDVLVSSLRPSLRKRARPAQPGKCWAIDNSWVTPSKWLGARVTSATILHQPNLTKKVHTSVMQGVRISIQARHELAIGDVLMRQQQPVGIVSRFVDDDHMPRQGNRPFDLIFPQAMAASLGLKPGGHRELQVGKSTEPARFALQARAMEVYSLISKQPLPNSPHPGQDVRTSHILWLQSRSLFGNLSELTSLKSDDLHGRRKLKQLLESGRLDPELIPSASAPESLLITQTYLRMLGLDAMLKTADNAVAITIRPASEEHMLSCSSGRVRKPETLNYRTLEGEKTGLLCPEIFGSSDNTQRRRFGHIVLPAPVVSFLWRAGHPSVLETALGVPGDTIERILSHKAWIRLEENGWQLLPGEVTEPGPSDFSGGSAIEAMLKRVTADRLPGAVKGRPEIFAQRIVPVGPPDIRPLVLLNNGNFATADVNDLYRMLINRANRLAKLQDLNAPAVILRNEENQLQKAFDRLQSNCLLPKPSSMERDGSRDPLVDCLKLLERQLHSDCKRVEWSGVARAITSGDIPKNQVRVPCQVYDILRLDSQSPVLLTARESNSGSFVSLLPQPHDHAVIELPLQAFSRLELTDVAPLCVLHRPLGTAACNEARMLLQGEIACIRPIATSRSWVDETSDADEFAHKLALAALEGATSVLRSPQTLMIGGTGSTDFDSDDDHPCTVGKTLEVNLPQ